MISFLGVIIQCCIAAAIGVAIGAAVLYPVGDWFMSVFVHRRPFPDYSLQKQESKSPQIIFKRTSPLQIKNSPQPTSLCSLVIPHNADFARPNSVIQICFQGTVAPQSSGVLSSYVLLDGEMIGLIPVTPVAPLLSRDRWSWDLTFTIDTDGAMKCNGIQNFRNNQYWLKNVPNTKKFVAFDRHEINITAEWGNMINPGNELEVDSVIVTSF